METQIKIFIIINVLGIVVSYLGSFLFDKKYLPRLFNEKIQNPFYKNNRAFKMLIPYILYWIVILILILIY